MLYEQNNELLTALFISVLEYRGSFIIWEPKFFRQYLVLSQLNVLIFLCWSADKIVEAFLISQRLKECPKEEWILLPDE